MHANTPQHHGFGGTGVSSKQASLASATARASMAQRQPVRDAGAWERRALAAALVEDHGVDVAWVGDGDGGGGGAAGGGAAADGTRWECRECVARAAREAPEAGEVDGGKEGIPGGRFRYCSLRGLIQHLRLQHDVWVY